MSRINYLLAVFLLLTPVLLPAQEQEAKIELTFQGDSVKTCTAKVTSNDSTVKEVEVKFYVKRLLSLLPIGEGVETDEDGLAEVVFPNDLPGDSTGNLFVVAKIEDHETYGTVETEALVQWGIKPDLHDSSWEKRSLSASREKAPTYLIIISNTIIAGVWLTLIYIFIQLFRISKSSTLKS